MKPFEKTYTTDNSPELVVRAINSYRGEPKWVLKVQRRGDGVIAMSYLGFFDDYGIQLWVARHTNAAMAKIVRRDIRKYLGLKEIDLGLAPLSIVKPHNYEN